MQIEFVSLSTQFSIAKIKHSVSSTQPSSVWLSVGMNVVWRFEGNVVEESSVGISIEAVGGLAGIAEGLSVLSIEGVKDASVGDGVTTLLA